MKMKILTVAFMPYSIFCNMLETVLNVELFTGTYISCYRSFSV